MAFWSKSFDEMRSEEAEAYYESQDYRERTYSLLRLLNANKTALQGKKIAFGSGILTSSYSEGFIRENKIRKKRRRPFSQEIIDWFDNEMIIWTSNTRAAVIEKLEAAGLSVESTRIIDYPEYLQAGGKERLETFEIGRLSTPGLEEMKNANLKHIKLPSVFGIDHLIDTRPNQLFGPGFNEDEDRYVPVPNFQPMSETDFFRDTALIEAMRRIIKVPSGTSLIDPFR